MIKILRKNINNNNYNIINNENLSQSIKENLTTKNEVDKITKIISILKDRAVEGISFSNFMKNVFYTLCRRTTELSHYFQFIDLKIDTYLDIGNLVKIQKDIKFLNNFFSEDENKILKILSNSIIYKEKLGFKKNYEFDLDKVIKVDSSNDIFKLIINDFEKKLV